MQKEVLFINLLDFDLNTLKMHDPYEESEDIIRVDLSRDKLKSILLYVDYHSVISFNENSCIINLKNSQDIKKKLEDIDSIIVSELQQRKIIKRLKKKFSYKQMVSSITVSEGDNIDILNLKVNINSNSNSNDNYKTKIYQNNSKELLINDAINLMKNNCLIKFVVELTSIVIDKANSLIYVDNILRQIKVKKIKPKRVETLPYSFVDSDDDNSENNSENNNIKKSIKDDNNNVNKNNDETNDEDIVKNILQYSNNNSETSIDNDDVDEDVDENEDNDNDNFQNYSDE